MAGSAGPVRVTLDEVQHLCFPLHPGALTYDALLVLIPLRNTGCNRHIVHRRAVHDLHVFPLQLRDAQVYAQDLDLLLELRHLVAVLDVRGLGLGLVGIA